jgi:hypothetical protein
VIEVKDTLENSNFDLGACEKPQPLPPKAIHLAVEPSYVTGEVREIEAGQEITLDNQVSEIRVEVL